MKRLMFVGGATALAATALLLPARSSDAGVPKVDVSNSAITCNTLLATAKISPGLVAGGTATSTALSVKGTIDGCTVTSGNTAIILTSKFTGKLLGTTNDCAALTGSAPLTGNLIIKWKADPTTPLVQTSSTVAVTSLTGGLFMPGGAFGPMTLASFTLGNGGVTGAFTGGDAGATSSNMSATSQDLGAILGQCGTVKGVKQLNIGFGTLTLK